MDYATKLREKLVRRLRRAGVDASTDASTVRAPLRHDLVASVLITSSTNKFDGEVVAFDVRISWLPAVSEERVDVGRSTVVRRRKAPRVLRAITAEILAFAP